MINLIAAISKNRQIGIHNQMPWHIPEDLKYFKKVTTGYPVIMGRKTFESIGHPLPNRRNIVLTRDTTFTHEHVEVLHSFEEALKLCYTLPNSFIIGGGEIYRAFLPYADHLYLTLVDKVVEGDTSFPPYEHNFKCVQAIPSQNQLVNGVNITFTLWDRK